jgi:predicted ester cyclase
MSISDTAMAFYDACETGKGWDTCKQYCHDNAAFSCQADMVAEITTLDAYTEWTKGLLTPIPDLKYEIHAFATDQDRNAVIVFATVRGTQTGEGGPVPPTGNSVAVEYVYTMQFDGDKIRSMAKVWNDVHTAKQLGWA